MNLINYKENSGQLRMFIMGMFVLCLMSLTSSVQADTPVRYFNRAVGTKISIQAGASYIASQANSSRVNKSKQFKVVKSASLSALILKSASASKPMLQAMASAQSMAANALASTVSATSTMNADEVADLARALNYDPIRIYNYVYNNIDYVPYFGVQKGAEQTLIDKTGNDFDQAVLLAVLLLDCPSSSGITSVNFEYGVMSMPRVGLANWVNVDPEFTLIENIFTDTGVPMGAVNTANDTLDLQRIWLQVMINGTTYILDPAYKQYDYKTGINIPQVTGYSQTNLLNTVNSGATITGYSVQNLNETALDSLLSSYSKNLITTIRGQYPNAQVSDIIGGRSIHQVTLASLPVSLPFATNSVQTWSSIAQQYFTTVEIQYDGLDLVVPSYFITGKRLMIVYTSSGSGVQPLIALENGYFTDSNGNALLGNEMADGTGGTMTITVTHPTSSVSNNFTSSYFLLASAMYAIISDFGGGVGNTIIKKRQQILNEALASGETFASNWDIEAETLNIMGLTYLKEIRNTTDILSQLAGVRTIYEHSIGRMAQEQSYYIDIADNTVNMESQHSNSNNIAGVFSSFVGFGSSLEDGMLSQMSPPNFQGMSTVSLLEQELSQGDKIYAIDSADLANITPLLKNYSSADLSDIQNWVNAGSVVFLPDNGLITKGQWQGPIYLVISNQSGAIEYAMGDDCGCGEDVTAGPVSTQTVISVDQANYPQTNQEPIATLKAAEPVDMTTGAFVHDHLDLSLGGQAPLGLSFSRHYLSSSNLIPTMLGNGWEHNYDIRLTQQSNSDAALGSRLPVEAASIVSSAYILQDLLNSQKSLEGFMAAALIQKWTTDQIYNNAINVDIGQKVLTYVQLPDGSYSPPPGVTITLVNNGNSTFSLKDRLGSTMNFNINNQVSSISDVDGNNMSFNYSSGNLLNKVTDQFSRYLNFVYNGNNQLSTVSDSTGRSVSYGYDANNNLTSFTDAAGKLWQYGYDGNYHMNSITNPLDIQAVSNAYDDQGRVITQAVPRQGGTNATYNFYFTGVNNLVQDPYGNLTYYNLDNEDRTISVENAIGATSSVTYDGQNHVITATDPLENQTTFTYDGTDDLTNIQDALLNNTVLGYDPQFDLTSVTDPLTHQTTFTYDLNNHHHLLSITDPEPLNNITTNFTYYPNGFLDTTTDPLKNVTTIAYDDYGNPETTATDTHPAITTNYDIIGRMLSLKDQVSSTTSFQYDPRNLLINKTDPLNKESVFTYDNAGQQITAKDRNGNTINYAYTPTENIDTISYPDSTTVKFAYDLDDRLINMTDPLGVTTYVYDGANRLSSYENGFGSKVSYIYDKANNITSLTYPDGKVVSYKYDVLNRIKTVTNWLNQTATYTYDNAGRLTNLINFNGTITNYNYDNANRLIGLAHTKSDSTPFLNYSFTLDADGNRKQVLQLEPITTAVNLGTASYSYNATKNRLASLSGITLTYDNEGQTLTQGSTTYGFDFEHRLISAPGVMYSYDGAGNRLKAVRYGAETRYVYDASGNLLAETNNINAITKYYIYGSGLLAMVDATTGDIYCYHFNATGNTIALTNSAQAIVNSYAYTPFGEVTEQQSINQPFKYVGQYGVYTEPSGLNYMKARYYDPTVGRFISEDPAGFGGSQVNLYAYVANNPISYVDPLGLESEKAEGENTSENPLDEDMPMAAGAPPPGGGDDSDDIINKTWTVSFTGGQNNSGTNFDNLLNKPNPHEDTNLIETTETPFVPPNFDKNWVDNAPKGPTWKIVAWTVMKFVKQYLNPGNTPH